jgi:hypothetical protein
MSPRFIYFLLNTTAVCAVASPMLLPHHMLPFFLAALAILSHSLRKQLCISVLRYASAL